MPIVDPRKETPKKESKFDSAPETRAHIKRVQDLLEQCRIILMNRAWIHDRSKLEEPEKSGFDECIPKLKELKYGSPEYLQALQDMKPTLDHHYANNPHHPEYWKDGIYNMSLFDILEMLMDWKAATERIKDGDIYKSINFNQGRFAIQPQLFQVLRNTAMEMQWPQQEESPSEL